MLLTLEVDVDDLQLGGQEAGRQQRPWEAHPVRQREGPAAENERVDNTGDEGEQQREERHAQRRSLRERSSDRSD